MDAEQLGASIRKRRRELGISQETLALLSGCSRPSIIAAEAGKATLRLDKLLSILAALGFRLALEDLQKGVDE